MSLQSWKLNGKRWEISVILKTATPLHVGSGEVCKHDDIKDKEGQFVDINACIKGKNNLPIIPGSTIKGKLYVWLKTRRVEDNLLENIFGKGHDRNTGDQGRGGKAEFHDAFITKELTGTQDWPYWREEFQTFIEASTAIERHKRVALHESLHYTETVPPGIHFKFTITGVMSDEEAALLIATLDSCDQNDHQPSFGAGDSNGRGHMKLEGYLQVNVMGAVEIAGWLNNFNQHDSKMAMLSARKLDQKDIELLIEKGKAQFSSPGNELTLGLTLKFAGPFLVNDPWAVINKAKDEESKTDYFPLLDHKKMPRLPAASFRGVLRTQAERIIRTLGEKCCDTEDPCKPIYKKEDLSGLCLACQIFGATGWKSLLIIQEFECLQANEIKKQDFVAIDRFHGGGKDGAKFDATHYESPEFKGAITFSPRMDKNELAWGKGLLALVLRDLQEGDLTFGFGANKGYGVLDSDSLSITDLEQLQDSDIQAFLEKCSALSQPRPCNDAKTPAYQSEKFPLAALRPSPEGFHNPYHFVPINEAKTDHWLPESALKATSHHSHAFYRNQTDQGEKLYHGRLICRLHTETPTFIGSAKKDDTEPAEIENYRLNGQIAIPATSLRGMISSLAEAASNSAMRVLENGLLSYRKTADDALRNVGMVIDNKNKKFVIPMRNAIKLKNAYTSGNMKSFIENSQSWSPEHNAVYYLAANPGNNNVPQESYAEGMTPGILRILGKEGRTEDLENKKHELFLPVPWDHVDKENNSFDYQAYKQAKLKTAIEIPSPVLERYLQLADQRTMTQKNDKELKKDETCQSVSWLPFHLKGTKRERSDDKHKICKLPVNEYALIYYAIARNEVTEISFSSIWRGRVKTEDNQAAKVYRFIPDDLLPFNNNRTTISPAELLFGFIEGENKQGEKPENALAFAGKVRVSAGTIPEYPEDDNELLHPEYITLKALSTPKPPSPALYFRTRNDNGNSYISKQELEPSLHAVKGRKYYLHAMRTEDQKKIQKLRSTGEAANGGDRELPWKTHDASERPQLKVKIRPIKNKQTFYFHLDFNNLTEWELGLLSYALRPTKSFRHRIGMGKPIGLGSVKLDIMALQTIDRQQRYSKIGTERFNQHNWKDDAYKDELEKAGYPVVQTADPLVPETLKKIFTDTMDSNIYRALELLGNPHNVKHPVHFPQVQNKPIEQKNYQWFVANDKGSDDGHNQLGPAVEVLKDLTENSDCLPTLTRHLWRGE
ncbi:MAG: TIGR03986 family CRISPR-associated RAMP protein [Methylococcaceae bacterium]|jgi:CRISPR-associated protein (TIGR03986 family)